MTRQTSALEHRNNYWVGRFNAMASPCEILMDVDDQAIAQELLSLASAEALRIEHKFSRYRDDNIIYRISHSSGNSIEVDEETANLFDYASQCYRLSEGMFDITSGVLRSAWKFDGSDNIPAQEQVAELLPHVGWDKVIWQRPVILLPAGMEIDLGGIGKEYAVDRTADILMRHCQASLLVNYGGDIRVTGLRRDGASWVIGIEGACATPTTQAGAARDDIKKIQISQGGVATSGDSRRYLLKEGVRYSHILNPRTGWPVSGAPSSVTVVAGTCTDAGILSTLAMLHGDQAEAFLEEQGVIFWCER